MHVMLIIRIQGLQSKQQVLYSIFSLVCLDGSQAGVFLTSTLATIACCVYRMWIDMCYSVIFMPPQMSRYVFIQLVQENIHEPSSHLSALLVFVGRNGCILPTQTINPFGIGRFCVCTLKKQESENFHRRDGNKMLNHFLLFLSSFFVFLFLLWVVTPNSTVITRAIPVKHSQFLYLEILRMKYFAAKKNRNK